jgi:hypothetical protein
MAAALAMEEERMGVLLSLVGVVEPPNQDGQFWPTPGEYETGTDTWWELYGKLL